MIQGCRKQIERKEGYELQLVMAMVTGCQWDNVMLALKKSTTGYAHSNLSIVKINNQGIMY